MSEPIDKSSTVIPLQMVCEMARNIPCAPWIFPKVTKLLKDENSSREQIEEVIRQDTGLASTMLRVANSAFFSRSPCESLSEAIMRLGNKEIYRLVASSVAVRWMGAEIKGYGWEPGDLSKHSVCVALAAQLISKDKKISEPDIAYSAGLFHDVGKMALAYACSDSFEMIRQYQQQMQCCWRQAEHDLLSYDHTDIGGTLMGMWAFPVNFIEVALYYSRPKLAAVEHRPLVTLVHAAKHVAINIGVGVGEEGFKTECDEESLLKEGYDPEYLEKMLPLTIIELEKMLGSDFKVERLTSKT